MGKKKKKNKKNKRNKHNVYKKKEVRHKEVRLSTRDKWVMVLEHVKDFENMKTTYLRYFILVSTAVFFFTSFDLRHVYEESSWLIWVMLGMFVFGVSGFIKHITKFIEEEKDKGKWK